MSQYIPTKLEWLEVELNSVVSGAGRGEVTLAYTARYPDTIVINVFYSAKTSASVLTEWENLAKKRVAVISGNHGWSWVKTEVQTDMQ